ncbi:glycoside hydrolase [Rhizoclosmatium globosum]|uniref:Glycoside hydrolase n=1 Tax=Rhizoclosmatium globosum TaxID=329046 RepID=A0A1Y2BQJ6_9FUNG|nr:glycoside hydrolase [Rhizoclosmatium globosum]|eukprot:ORY37003.1 glycoside hydrolase [Rhizoclosmatium globosum]
MSEKEALLLAATTTSSTSNATTSYSLVVFPVVLLTTVGLRMLGLVSSIHVLGVLGVGGFAGICLLVQSINKKKEDSKAEKSEKSVERWSEKKAHEWYAKQPWLVGANFLPSTASNQLEMFQAETFNPSSIDRDLKLAASIGMNTMRVFLHDLLFDNDPTGFLDRIDIFLSICSKHGIRPMIVFFDSRPQLTMGEIPSLQHLGDLSQQPRLEHYIRSVIRRFKNDHRNFGSWDYMPVITQLFPKIYRWIREEGATQPITSGVYGFDDPFTEFQELQIALSDIITFHSYDPPATFLKYLNRLKPYNRPIICTEWLARTLGSTPAAILPVGKKENIGMINWGLWMVGCRQSFLGIVWESYDHEPNPWFHDLFTGDGFCILRRKGMCFGEKRRGGFC